MKVLGFSLELEGLLGLLAKPVSSPYNLVMTIRSHQRGTLIGPTTVHALGAAADFPMPVAFTEVTGYCSGGPKWPLS